MEAFLSVITEKANVITLRARKILHPEIFSNKVFSSYYRFLSGLRSGIWGKTYKIMIKPPIRMSKVPNRT